MTTPLRLPTGTVTFLFTDIEGSTALWGRAPAAMNEALANHDAIFRDVVAAHDGAIFKTVGDAVCAAFARADSAITAAIAAQRRLDAQNWPHETGPLRVRMGIHTGQAIERDNDYFGPALNRVARLMSIAHGGQVLVSRATAAVVDGILDSSIHLRDAGVHHLKGLAEPETAYQVLAPGIEVEFPPRLASGGLPNNLPAQISSFVGRTNELATLSELTLQHRLVTIVGPGGIGKTRISLQLAENILARFPDGAWAVELAAVSDPALIAQTIADAFRLREQPQSPIDDQLIAFLAVKKLLLVLDNSEHLVAATALLAKRLLVHCPDLLIVTTSREPLHVVGEQVFRLPPLGAESVELFLDRARAVRPDFALSEADRSTVAAICTRLEGIPLAIELAAARIVTLPLPELSKRLAQRFDLLTSRDGTQDERHRTLWAAIDWSYRLLDDADRTFLRNLAAFEGGFSLDAAATVAEIPNTAALDRSESLVDKSLAIVQLDDATARYSLADLVKEYLRRELHERGEDRALCGRHFDYYRAYAQGGDDRSIGARETWMARITADIANIRTAIQWGVVERPAEAAEILVELSNYWQARGSITEGEKQLRRILALPEVADLQRAPLLRRAATFATIRGAYDDARELTLEARDAYERLGDAGGIAEALHNVAVIAHRTGDDVGAERHYGEALSQFRHVGHTRGELACLLNLTLLALKIDDFATAERYLGEAGPIAEKLADAGMQSYLIGLFGTLAFRRGNFEEAVRSYAEALAIKRRLGERFDTAEILDRIAEATLKLGDIAAARETSAESLRIALELDAHVLIIRSFETFAEIALYDSDAFEARTCFEHARALREEHGYRHSIRDLDALGAEITNRVSGQSGPDAEQRSIGWRETAARLASHSHHEPRNEDYDVKTAT
jgi:predicted ATPase/class 3 adenylate cyclase